jgi:hypothetical protein
MTSLITSQRYDRLDVSEGPIHQVITLRAGNTFRSFCNYLWCTYEEVSTNSEETEVLATEHESLNDN